MRWNKEELIIKMAHDQRMFEAAIKDADFSYAENDYVVFAAPEIIKGNERIALIVFIDNKWKLGSMDDRDITKPVFKQTSGNYYPEEIVWLITKLRLLQEIFSSQGSKQ